MPRLTFFCSWTKKEMCVCLFVFVCRSGQLLWGSWPLAWSFVCRDRQQHSPWRVALRLHRCGHTYWHTACCQTLLLVSQQYAFLCICLPNSLLLQLLFWNTHFCIHISSSSFSPRWATTANSSSSASIDSRTYDEVYESVAVRKFYFSLILSKWWDTKTFILNTADTEMFKSSPLSYIHSLKFIANLQNTNTIFL